MTLSQREIDEACTFLEQHQKPKRKPPKTRKAKNQGRGNINKCQTWRKILIRVRGKLGLQPSAPLSGVCLAICSEMGWPLPPTAAAQKPFVKKYDQASMGRSAHPPVDFDRDEFYKSREWESLRYAKLVESAGACQACGLRGGTDGTALHVDHIIPISLDPARALDSENLQVLCEFCDRGKGNFDKTDWRNK